MLKFNFCIFIALISFANIAPGQVALKDTIPFKLTAHNNISIQAILNQKDTIDLMFHTASNSVTLTEEATRKLTRINWERSDATQSWGGTGTARFSKGNTLKIDGMEWAQIPIWESKHSGPGTDGKFGPNLFEDKVIEINYDQGIIVLHPRLPETISSYQKLQLFSENGFLFIKGNCKIDGEVYQNQFLIHSGFGGTLLLDDKFVEKHKIGDKLSVIAEKELKDSYGNILKTKKATLPAFFLGKSKLSDIPVGFFEGAIGKQKISVIGGDILRRFNIIIDSERSFIYLRANDLMGLPYSDV